MPIDPANPGDLDPQRARAERFAALERRVSALERSHPVIHSGAGNPTTNPRNGAPYVSETTPRLWIRVAGVWRYTTLT